MSINPQRFLRSVKRRRIEDHFNLLFEVSLKQFIFFLTLSGQHDFLRSGIRYRNKDLVQFRCNWHHAAGHDNPTTDDQRGHDRTIGKAGEQADNLGDRDSIADAAILEIVEI